MLYMMENMDFKNFDKIYLFTANNDSTSLIKTFNFLKNNCKNFEI